MWLQKLSLINFKNYAEAELDMSETVNAFTGNNGAGKTNLLDAIHYLSLCKSYFNPIDVQQIRHQEDFFMIQGVFDKKEKAETISCSLKRHQKKQFKRNKKEYQRLADHIGLFPLVMISPNDISIILEGSEERRRFMDTIISQTDTQYLDQLISYNKTLLNRNILLKHIAETGRYDQSLLEVYDSQLAAHGDAIYARRKEFMETFIPVFDKHYSYISDDAEQVQLNYESPLHEDSLENLLVKNRERDRALERTSAGIHKDELQFGIHGHPLKKFGSQGQQKSFLIALKLAQYSYIFQKKGFKPLLLLDDIFDKLDERRTTKLMHMVSEHDFGQIFITDTSEQRVVGIFESIGIGLRLFNVDKGQVSNGKDQ